MFHVAFNCWPSDNKTGEESFEKFGLRSVFVVCLTLGRCYGECVVFIYVWSALRRDRVLQLPMNLNDVISCASPQEKKTLHKQTS